MSAFIDYCLSHSRTVVLLLLLLLIRGFDAYEHIPKEDRPDIVVPIIYVSVFYDGISPEDAEKFLVKPLERNARSIKGIKKIQSTSALNTGIVMLEFLAGFNAERALQDVREQVNKTKSDWPEGTKEPEIREINLSEFPVLTLLLGGDIPEKAMHRIVRDLKDTILTLPNILSVTISGLREEVIEIIVHPDKLLHYGITSDRLYALIRQNNQLIAAGQLLTHSGTFAIKVPTLMETTEDFLNFPIKVANGATIRLRDLASIHRTFKDASTLSRTNGMPSVALNISKRTGSNIIDTIDRVKNLVEEERKAWPSHLSVNYMNDGSQTIRDMLNDLENNIIFAVILAMIPIIWTMGLRSAGLVAIAVPGSFVFGILVLYIAGFTLNIVVLFSLILSVGMLVDAAIVVCEYADRRLMTGSSPREAYGLAVKRMFAPIMAGTFTSIIVFIPLLFWPGIIGGFMQYMPITIIVTVTGSLLMAFIFLPTLGTLFPAVKEIPAEVRASLEASESDGNIDDLRGFTGAYVSLLRGALRYPLLVVTMITGALIGVIFIYKALGVGVEFFPDVEPDQAMVDVRVLGNLSLDQQDAIMKEVEKRLLPLSRDVRTFNSQVGVSQSTQDAPGRIGIIYLDLKDWKERRRARAIIEDARAYLQDVHGATILLTKERSGPGGQHPIALEVSHDDRSLLENDAKRLIEALQAMPGAVDVESSLPPPGIEWHLEVDRQKALEYGVPLPVLGAHVRMVTSGYVLTTVRPDDTIEELDVVLRFPEAQRTLTQLDTMRIATDRGSIPISYFVTRTAKPLSGSIKHIHLKRTVTIYADIGPGVLADSIVKDLKTWLAANPLQSQVHFAGDEEDQNETRTFLVNAFLLALIVMTLTMVAQFNSFYKMFIIMSAVFLSTGGVLLGLLMTHQPFGIVMCGVGVIALAGTVVNNNIIFLDTYDELSATQMSIHDAIIRTGAQRLRPILLTAGTGVLGLIPMVFGINIDFLLREITYDAPSSQWWRQLSTTIAGGLTFATILTLFFTPCLLMLGHRVHGWWRRLRYGEAMQEG